MALPLIAKFDAWVWHPVAKRLTKDKLIQVDESRLKEYYMSISMAEVVTFTIGLLVGGLAG